MVLLGILLLGFLLIIGLKEFNKRALKNEIDAARKKINEFKKNADEIQVDLAAINITSNNWKEDVVINNSRSGGYNQFVGRGDLNIETIEHNPNVLHLKVLYREEFIDIYHRVNMDSTVLKMKLAMQKATILYINPSDSSFYLDMEFLESE